MYSVNKAAMRFVQEMIDSPERFGIGVKTDASGVHLLDLGVEYPGSWLAGKYFINILCGGFATVSFGRFELDGTPLATVDVVVDNPILAVIASQLSMWEVGAQEEFAPVVSGPARAIARADHYIQSIEYKDPHHQAVVGVQGDKFPSPQLIAAVVKQLDLAPDDVYFLVAPTGSLVGMIQLMGRSVEQSIHNLVELNYDLTRVQGCFGSVPLPPLIRDETKAMGRGNDSLIYGSTQHVTVQDDDEVVKALVPKMVSTRTDQYGQLFEDIYKAAGYSFLNVDFSLDAGAKVSITNNTTGNTFTAGRINRKMLKKSFNL